MIDWIGHLDVVIDAEVDCEGAEAAARAHTRK